MVEYWNCGKLPWPDIEEFVDRNVGEALKFYVEEDGVLILRWDDEPEPMVAFYTGDCGEFEKKESLFELLVFQLGTLRPGGKDDDDLFYDPEGRRHVVLLQELVRTYLEWRKGG